MALSSRCFGGLRRLLKKLTGDADCACKGIVDGFAAWRGDSLSSAAIAKDRSAFIAAPPRRTNRATELWFDQGEVLGAVRRRIRARAERIRRRTGVVRRL